MYVYFRVCVFCICIYTHTRTHTQSKRRVTLSCRPVMHAIILLCFLIIFFSPKTIPFFPPPKVFPNAILLRLCLGSIQALLRLFSGSIKALEGTFEPLLRIY